MHKTRLVLTLLLIAAIPSLALSNVTVKRDPPDVQYKTFDPANPPAEMPHLAPGEDAATAFSFRIQAGANSDVLDRKKTDAGWSATVAVHGVTIAIQLHVVIWTPKGVGDKLKAHEEGHRKIAEKVYMDRAILEAKAAGAVIDGKRMSGDGPNWKTAAGNAIDGAINDVGKKYLQHTAAVATEVGDIYDALTQHGTNDKPEADAIREAFEKYEANHPATRPAKNP
jgi:hypothetical protein